MESEPDNVLMQRVCSGELDQLGQLFERHQSRLFNFFLQLTQNRESSQDLVQEVFLRILKYRQTFNSQHSFQSWMYQIARRARNDLWRKEASSQPVSSPTERINEIRICPEPGPDERLSQSQEIQQLELALASLPIEKRELLVLSQIQRLKHEEIAAILECGSGAVKVRIHRAMQDLREAYQEIGSEKEKSV